MSIAQSLLPEFDHEMANTRKYLEQMPEGQNDWKPHEKSMGLAMLASHIVELPAWLVSTMSSDSMDLAPVDGEPYSTKVLETRQELLDAFDEAVVAGRTALAATSDEQMMQTWSLLSAGNEIMSMPRVAVVRGFVMNHLIHHRGQLGVYFRLLDVTVPAVYGPSADEA